MSHIGWLQPVLYFLLLFALVKPLGSYMAKVYQGERTIFTPIIAPAELLFYRLLGICSQDEMDWKTYAMAILWFSLFGFAVLFVLQLIQRWLPFNPQGLPGVAPDLAFNTAASFVSNTNWQSYSGKTTLSYSTQMLGLTVQNFVSAGTGMAVLVALVRGIVRHTSESIGNFWVDLTAQRALHIATSGAPVLDCPGISGRCTDH